MQTVSQPDSNPTNKLTAATIGAALVSVSGLIMRNLLPEWYDPEVWMNLMPIVVFALGWFVKDRPTVLVVEKKDE